MNPSPFTIHHSPFTILPFLALFTVLGLTFPRTPAESLYYLALAALGLLLYTLTHRPRWPWLAIITLPALISTSLNSDILTHSLMRVGVFGGVALLGYQLGYLLYNQVEDALYLLAWLWPFGWLISPALLGHPPNLNVWAGYSLIFFALGLHRGKPILVFTQGFLMLFVFQSRGAFLGAILILAWVYRHYWYIWLILALLTLLTFHPDLNALKRLAYWQAGFDTWLTAPLVGIGPGGIFARQIVLEPGQTWPQIHVHNLPLRLLVETGLLGFTTALGLITWAISKKPNLAPWHIYLIIGLLTHSMVDDPLWWPGILAIVALIAGHAVKYNESLLLRQSIQRNANQRLLNLRPTSSQ